MPSASVGFSHWCKRARMDQAHLPPAVEAKTQKCVDAGNLRAADNGCDESESGSSAGEEVAAQGIGEVMIEAAALAHGNAEEIEHCRVLGAEQAIQPGNNDCEIVEAVHGFDVDLEPEWGHFAEDSHDQGYEEDTDGSDHDDCDYDQSVSESDDQGYAEIIISSSSDECDDDSDTGGEANGDDEGEEVHELNGVGDVDYAEWADLPLYAGARLTCRWAAILLTDLVHKRDLPRRRLPSLLRLLDRLLPPGHRLCRTVRQLWRLAEV